MKLIHRHEEGGLIRNGLSYTTGDGRLTDLILKLGRRVIFLLSTHDGFGYFIDLRRDHQMYRPNDTNQLYLLCRHCGGLSTHKVGSFCSGKLYKRWRNKR